MLMGAQDRCPLCGSTLKEPLTTYWRLQHAGPGERVPDSEVTAHQSCILDRFERVERSDANVKSARTHLGLHSLTDGKYEYAAKPVRRA